MKKLQIFFSGLLILWLGITVFSCSTTGVSPTNYTRIKVINALAGSSPLNFYLNNTIGSTATITFPAASGYISAVPGSKFFQVSLATTPTLYFDPTYITLNTDSSYSVFVTGQTGSYTSIFTRDTLTAPSLGKAKIRFVNASTNSGPLNITINAVSGYSNINYKGVGSLIEVPAGTYEFKAYSNTSTSSTLATLSNQVLADGQVYTLYAAGLLGSTATNAVFGLSLIANLPSATK